MRGYKRNNNQINEGAATVMMAAFFIFASSYI